MRGAIISGVLLLASALPVWGFPGSAEPVTEASQTVELRGTTRQIFRQLERILQRRIVVDAGVRRRQVEFVIDRNDLTGALDVATTVTGAFWVAQPDGSILVATNDAASRQRYLPQMFRDFPLMGYPDEVVNEIVTLLRQHVEPPYMSVDRASGTITVRDTPHRLEVIAALVEQWTPYKEEIMLDVLMLEVDRQEATRIGILPPDLVVAVNIGAGVLPTDDPQALLQAIEELVRQGVLPAVLLTDRFDFAKGVPLIGFGGGLTRYIANLPNAALTFEDIRKTIRSLRYMQLRITAGSEATFFTGAQFPITFATFSIIFIPEIIRELIDSGDFRPPPPAIRYEDLGIRLTATAQVHNNRDVSLKVLLESTQLVGQSINDIPILGTRTIEHSVRVKLGEPVILSGMRGLERSPIRVGLPVLGAIPLLGRLFSRKQTNVRETELLVMLTPRLIRRGRPEHLKNMAIYVGSEADFAPVGKGGTAGRGAGSRRRTVPRRQFQPRQGQPRSPRAPQQQRPQRNQ